MLILILRIYLLKPFLTTVTAFSLLYLIVSSQCLKKVFLKIPNFKGFFIVTISSRCSFCTHFIQSKVFYVLCNFLHSILYDFFIHIYLYQSNIVIFRTTINTLQSVSVIFTMDYLSILDYLNIF